MALTAFGDALNSIFTKNVDNAFNSMWNRANMRYQEELSQQHIRDSYSSARQGLEKAGLSPQLLASGNVVSSPSYSSPYQDMSVTSGYTGGLSRRQQARIAERTAEINAAQQASWSELLKARAQEARAEASIKQHDASIYTQSSFPSDSRAWGFPISALEGGLSNLAANDSVMTAAKNLFKAFGTPARSIANPVGTVTGVLLDKTGGSWQKAKQTGKKIWNKIGSGARRLGSSFKQAVLVNYGKKGYGGK